MPALACCGDLAAAVDARRQRPGMRRMQLVPCRLAPARRTRCGRPAPPRSAAAMHARRRAAGRAPRRAPRLLSQQLDRAGGQLRVGVLAQAQRARHAHDVLRAHALQRARRRRELAWAAHHLRRAGRPLASRRRAERCWAAPRNALHTPAGACSAARDEEARGGAGHARPGRARCCSVTGAARCAAQAGPRRPGRAPGAGRTSRAHPQSTRRPGCAAGAPSRTPPARRPRAPGAARRRPRCGPPSSSARRPAGAPARAAAPPARRRERGSWSIAASANAGRPPRRAGTAGPRRLRLHGRRAAAGAMTHVRGADARGTAGARPGGRAGRPSGRCSLSREGVHARLSRQLHSFKQQGALSAGACSGSA